MEHDSMYAPLFKDGQVLKLGELYFRPEYAKTLELIARKGSEAFYQGEVAEALVKVVRERGGLMGLDDLQSIHLWRHMGV
jgi:gamma-glutamyltranspeptidase/glutathione hydrolase